VTFVQLQAAIASLSAQLFGANLQGQCPQRERRPSRRRRMHLSTHALAQEFREKMTQQMWLKNKKKEGKLRRKWDKNTLEDPRVSLGRTEGPQCATWRMTILSREKNTPFETGLEKQY
jgi:hypothetical protein